MSDYFPNSFDDIKPDERYKAQPLELDTNIADHYNRKAEGENDHYSQSGIFYREVLSDHDKKNLVGNIVGAMKRISGSKNQRSSTDSFAIFSAQILD